MAEKAGALACSSPDEAGVASLERSLLEASNGLGADHILLAAGGHSNGPVETGRAAGTRPGSGRRHRQVQARPAVERVLRQGARRPVLPLVRPRSLRRPLRARGHRLPRRLRPLDRAPQPRVLHRPDRPRTDRRRLPDRRHLPRRRRHRRLPATQQRRAPRRRLPLRVPGCSTAGERAADDNCSRDLQVLPLEPCGLGSSARATTRRACCSRICRRTRMRSWRSGDDVAVGCERAEEVRVRADLDGCHRGADDDSLDVVFVVTRHSSHAELACRALEAGKAVFVEKPLALTTEELDRILDTVDATGNDRLMVGFNRRFAPLLADLKDRFGDPGGSYSLRYLVNAGQLDSTSWYLDAGKEGTRFVGEGGHFIDTLSWWLNSAPTEVYAVPGPDAATSSSRCDSRTARSPRSATSAAATRGSRRRRSTSPAAAATAGSTTSGARRCGPAASRPPASPAASTRASGPSSNASSPRSSPAARCRSRSTR